MDLSLLIFTPSLERKFSLKPLRSTLTRSVSMRDICCYILLNFFPVRWVRHFKFGPKSAFLWICTVCFATHFCSVLNCHTFHICFAIYHVLTFKFSWGHFSIFWGLLMKAAMLRCNWKKLFPKMFECLECFDKLFGEILEKDLRKGSFLLNLKTYSF